MLTLKQRCSVARVLVKAYYRYRDLSLLKICRTQGIGLIIDHKEPLGGHAGHKYVKIPGKCPKLYKEHVFWHEFCHTLTQGLGFYPRLIGYQGHLQQFDRDGGYWIWERLCEAFADLMMLYRHLEYTPPNVGDFLFADSSSIGYAEVASYSLRRVTTHCDKAVETGRNIDLHDLRAMLKQQERFIAQAEHQQMLPTAFREHHQNPGPCFVDESKDSLVNERHWGKESWKWKHPIEQKILKRISSLKALEAQPRLFDQMTESDRQEFERQVEVLDRYIKRF